MSSESAPSFRFSRLLRDAMQGEKFSPASGLRVARPIDAESLVGRHEGRRSTDAFRSALSSRLQKRVGSSRKLAKKSGKASQFKFDPRQRAIVKVHYFSHGGGGGSALGAHARYVARDAAVRAQTPQSPDQDLSPEAESRAQQRAERSVFYDAHNDGVNGSARAAQWAREDRRHFRLILSAENGGGLDDLRSYTREVMRRAEIALGTRLEWIAADHWDTDNPHTHIILRGRREDGRDLVIPREYVSHGFRSAAQDVATERLGPRGRDDARRSLEREARAHRPSRLDRILEPHLDAQGRLQLGRLIAKSPEMTNALKARVQELKRLGLATEIKRNVFEFELGWREALKAMELHLDIRKARMQARDQDRSRHFEQSRSKTRSPGRDR